MKKDWDRNPVIIILGILASCIAVFTFFTGIQSINGIDEKLTQPTSVIPESKSEIEPTPTPEPLPSATPYPTIAVINQYTIIGLWYSEIINGGTYEVRQDQDNSGCFVMIVASDESQTNYKGEVMGKVCYNGNEESYVGKHIWGGGKSDKTWWGEDGGLVITIVNADTLFMRFLDSQYTGGWTLTRLR